jgi:hypothetical protein
VNAASRRSLRDGHDGAIGRMGSGSIHPCGCAIVVDRSDVEIPIGENHRRIALWLSEVE